MQHFKIDQVVTVFYSGSVSSILVFGFCSDIGSIHIAQISEDEFTEWVLK